MKVMHSKIFVTTLLATNGKIFDKEKLLESNLLDDAEKKSVRLILGGYGISYQSNINYDDVPEADYIKWFTPIMVDKPMEDYIQD